MTILAIDDDPDDTELFCEAVAYINSSELVVASKEKVDCLAVNNCAKALDVLASLNNLPDYIFLDINMPGMGGKECLTYLKHNNRLSKIEVIMFSTAFGQRESTEFKAMGALDCILKPSGFNALVKLLTKYIYRNIYEK